MADHDGEALALVAALGQGGGRAVQRGRDPVGDDVGRLAVWGVPVDVLGGVGLAGRGGGRRAARCRWEETIMSGPSAARSLPARSAWASPVASSGTSLWPWKRR